MLQTGLWLAKIMTDLERAKASSDPERSLQNPVSRRERHLISQMGSTLVSLGKRFEQYGVPQPLRMVQQNPS